MRSIVSSRGWGAIEWYNHTQIGLSQYSSTGLAHGYASESFSISAMLADPDAGLSLALDFGGAGPLEATGTNNAPLGTVLGVPNMTQHRNFELPNITPCLSNYSSDTSASSWDIHVVMAGIVNYPSEDYDLDGVPNDNDTFPHDPAESSGLDGDGIGDNADQ